MSFLHGSDFALLAQNDASCATLRHARRCLLRQSLHVSEHRLRTQLEFLKEHTPPISFRITVADPSKGFSSILTSQVSGTHTGLSSEKNLPSSMLFTSVLILSCSTSTVTVETSSGGTPCRNLQRLTPLCTAGRHRQRRSPGSSHRRPHP